MADSIDAHESCLTSNDLPPNPTWLIDGGFIPVIIGIAAMFWGITFVCEEFAVPALSAFCKRNRFSDALTGSIFIGTGLSLPVFFVAVAGLFASNSAIGVGAVVGGNLFNHLITIPSTIYICPEQTMKLDALIFSREMLFYFASCLLVLWAVKSNDANFTDAFANAFSQTEWDRCLTIPWIPSLSLVIGYVGYCLIDSNFYLVEELLGRNWTVPISSQSSVNADVIEYEVNPARLSEEKSNSDSIEQRINSVVDDENMSIKSQDSNSKKSPDDSTSRSNSHCCEGLRERPQSSKSSTVLVDITVQLSSTSVDIEANDNTVPVTANNNNMNDNEKKSETSSVAVLQESLAEAIKAKSM